MAHGPFRQPQLCGRAGADAPGHCPAIGTAHVDGPVGRDLSLHVLLANGRPAQLGTRRQRDIDIGEPDRRAGRAGAYVPVRPCASMSCRNGRLAGYVTDVARPAQPRHRVLFVRHFDQILIRPRLVVTITLSLDSYYLTAGECGLISWSPRATSWSNTRSTMPCVFLSRPAVPAEFHSASSRSSGSAVRRCG